MKEIFIDAGIILDLLAKRDPHYNYSAKLFSLIDSKKTIGFTSPIIIANINYILTRILGKNKAIKNIQKIVTILKILPVDEKIIKLALSSDFSDFEDAIQYYTTIDNNINFLITRNIKDYKPAKIQILTAEEYITIYHLSS